MFFYSFASFRLRIYCQLSFGDGFDEPNSLAVSAS